MLLRIRGFIKRINMKSLLLSVRRKKLEKQRGVEALTSQCRNRYLSTSTRQYFGLTRLEANQPVGIPGKYDVESTR